MQHILEGQVAVIDGQELWLLREAALDGRFG